MFSDEFLASQKVCQASQLLTTLAETVETSRWFWEGSAGEAVCRGGDRGGVMLPEFEDFTREHSVFSMPLTPKRTRVVNFVLSVSIASIVS